MVLLSEGQNVYHFLAKNSTRSRPIGRVSFCLPQTSTDPLYLPVADPSRVNSETEEDSPIATPFRGYEPGAGALSSHFY
jgi:hypothetical protein